MLDLPEGYRGIKNDYFQRFLTFHGIPIMAPGTVDDFAIQECRWVLTKMFETADHRIGSLYATNLFIAIAPEFQEGVFNFELPNVRIILVGEDNLIDRDAQSSILIHEVGHAIHDSLCQYEKRHITELYENRPFWGTDENYAQQNEHEYFAEGVGAYFSAGVPTEPVNKRSVLQSFDPSLYHTIRAVFGYNEWLWQPINQRTVLSEHTLEANFKRSSLDTLQEYYEHKTESHTIST